VRIWNATTGECAEGHWNGYHGDYLNISLNRTLTLREGVTYNFTIRTGSYPQLHHQAELQLQVAGSGIIRCTTFTDANGKEYDKAIPAFKLYGNDNQ